MSEEFWRDRAHLAETRVIHAEGDVRRARSDVRWWRHFAVFGWAWVFALTAEMAWHWSYWAAPLIAGGAASINSGVDYWRIRRAAKQESAQQEAERRAFVAE